MSQFSIRYNPEEDIIRVEMLGEFDARMLSASTAALVEEIQRSACTRVLWGIDRLRPSCQSSSSTGGLR